MFLFRRRIDKALGNRRSVWLRTAVCALLGFLLAYRGIAFQHGPSTTFDMIFLAAVTGAFCLGGLLLSLMDVVKSRLDEGARVNLVARAYFGMGPWSVLLWVVTLPAMIMFVIIFGILIYDMVITIFPRM